MNTQPAVPASPPARPLRPRPDARWPSGLRFADDGREARRPHAPDPRWPRSPYPARAIARSAAASCADQGEDA